MRPSIDATATIKLKNWTFKKLLGVTKKNCTCLCCVSGVQTIHLLFKTIVYKIHISEVGEKYSKVNF